MEFIDRLKSTFKQGDTVIRLVYINGGVFILASIVSIFAELFRIEGLNVSQWLGMPADSNSLLLHFWTPITYMFYHEQFFHILFNMFALYWFGRMFLYYFSSRQLVSLYILGGLFGALFYYFGYNFIPYYKSVSGYSILLGASGSIMALIVATAVKSPNMELQLILLGRIKLKWVAVATVLISFFGLTKDNAGGELAHLGGALAGYLFALLYQKGVDVSKYISSVIDFFANIFKPKREKKQFKRTKYNEARMSPEQYNQTKAQKEKDIDEILEKIKRSGYESLSAEEKKKLFDQKG